MFIYTSGTTGRPKGVVHTHASLEAQAAALREAWGWSESDRALNVLPLHHVHGVVNVVYTALRAGATLEMAPRFDAAAAWETLRRPRGAEDAVTVFQAVPTVYAKMIAHAEALPEGERERLRAEVRGGGARLMVSGSAALPPAVLDAWRELTGHTLLERYGMTECGMALSNPLEPVSGRVPGTVGAPRPGVEARLDGVANPLADGEGELLVRGRNLFARYHGRPEATAEAVDADGWLRTGDLARRAGGRYSIRGRLSADIIKSAGYKISALDVEACLLTHPAVAEAVVFGTPDDVYGERVAALVVPRPGAAGTEPGDALARDPVGELRAFGERSLSPYKLPTRARVVDEIPRNAMGKVNKRELARVTEFS